MDFFSLATNLGMGLKYRRTMFPEYFLGLTQFNEKRHFTLFRSKIKSESHICTGKKDLCKKKLKTNSL